MPFFGSRAASFSKLASSLVRDSRSRSRVLHSLLVAAACGSTTTALLYATQARSARCEANGIPSKAPISKPKVSDIMTKVMNESKGDIPVEEASAETKEDTSRSRRTYYPEIECYDCGHLNVGDGHCIYYEQSGNPAGKPVVFLHGGPGAGTSPLCRRFFNPDVYRIVVYDQRGGGKSIPKGSIENNTTWDLVEDMEKLRTHLGIDRWQCGGGKAIPKGSLENNTTWDLVEDMEELRTHLGISKWQVFGGSWGSTLAVTYAICHPAVVTELVLRGVYLFRDSEADWLFGCKGAGAKNMFPENFEKFENYIPENERGDFAKAYQKRILSADKRVAVEAAKHWINWEGDMCVLRPDLRKPSKHSNDDILAFGRIENHYFVYKGFYERDGWLLEKEQIAKIRNIPTTIVQGRYDVVCPPTSAYELHKQLPNSELVIVPDAGHSGFEPGMVSELVRATDKFGGVQKR